MESKEARKVRNIRMNDVEWSAAKFIGMERLRKLALAEARRLIKATTKPPKEQA